MSNPASTAATIAPPMPPKLQAIAERAGAVVGLALERAVGNARDPNRYPLPRGPKSMELLLKGQIDRLSPERKQALVDSIGPKLAESKQSRQRRLGDLSRVDLAGSTSVVDQVGSLGLPSKLKLSTRDVVEFEAIARKWHMPFIPTPTGPAPGGTASRVALELERVTCVDDTRESGSDEMVLAGLFIDPFGQGREMDVVGLGSFRTGSVINYSDRELAAIDISAGGFPKTFAAFPLLVEVDRADEDADLQDNVLGVIGTLLLALGAIETLLMSLIASPLALVALIIGIIGGVLMILEIALRDDYFPADQGFGVLVESSSLTPPAGAEKTFRFEAHGGKYDVKRAFVPKA